MSDSSDRNNASNESGQNEIKTTNDQRNLTVERSIELGSGANEVTRMDTNANTISTQRINTTQNNHYWSYPLQPQHSQMSISAEFPNNLNNINNLNNLNVNLNDINQDDSALFGIDDYYNENDNNNNLDDIINPLFQQLQQNPGMTIDTLILNLSSVINNEK